MRNERVTHETSPSQTPLLDLIKLPSHLRSQPATELRRIADELRRETIETVAVTGGHLGASLGVIELTVALHYVFETPNDRLVWDVGHQAYPHKILTGRRDRIRSLRKGGGLSGFTKRAESEYDPFGAAHSSTSISSALGFAVARDLQGHERNVIAVIGDGAMSAGMAYEAMNHAGFLDTNMIVILNDNQQVSLPTQYNGKNQDPVGGLSSALARLQANRPLRELREIAKGVSKQLPEPLQEATAKIDEYARGMISGSGSTLFEELGLYYIGPVDGHNLDDLIAVLQDVKSAATVGPVLVSLKKKRKERVFFLPFFLSLKFSRGKKNDGRRKKLTFFFLFLFLPSFPLPFQNPTNPINKTKQNYQHRSTSSPKRAEATPPPRPRATRCTA